MRYARLRRPMHRWVCSVLALASLLALWLGPGIARAQSTTGTTGSESISAAIPNPSRSLYQNGQWVDVTNIPRPQNLNPEGVNFSDCAQDLKLTFSLILSGFNGGSAVEAWAGTGDCTQTGNRGYGSATQQLCWRVGPPGQVLLYGTPTAVSFDVYARDVLRYETTTAGTSTNQLSYDASFHDPNNQSGYSACFVQPTDAAVALNVWFIPVQLPSGNNTGTAYQWPPSGSATTFDLVAPPPPTVNQLGIGDTLLLVNWTSPGNDPDIAGFAVFSDPPAGGTTSGGCNCGSAPGSGGSSPDTSAASNATDGPTPWDGPIPDQAVLVCPDATTSPAAEAASLFDGGSESATETDAPSETGDDGSLATPVGAELAGDDASLSNDSGCYTINSSGGGSSCQSFNLTSSVVLAEGGATTPIALAPASTEGGFAALGDDGSTSSGVTLSGGGISQIPLQFKAGEIDDRGATSDTLTGLTNQVSYAVVVATVDGSGNVGPPSAPLCGIPAPVNDFFGKYRTAGGQAGGSCALEGSAGLPVQAPVFAIGVGAAVLALLRRRTRT